MIKGSFQVSIAIVKNFLADFWSKIWLGHVTCKMGRRWPNIWIRWPRFAYSLYSFHGATMTIKGSLKMSIPIVKAFLREILSRQKLANDLRFGEKMGSKCKTLFSGPQKAHSCVKRRHLTYWLWKSVMGSWLYAEGRTKKLDAHFRIFGDRKGENVSW